MPASGVGGCGLVSCNGGSEASGDGGGGGDKESCLT